MTLRASRDAVANEPLLTVAVPAYGNWDYLRLCLESVTRQTARDFEVLVSEDCARDDRIHEVTTLLDESGLPYQVHRQHRNLGYDGNVRFCLRAARGRYVLLLGHDDALASPEEVECLSQALADLGHPEVAFTNFQDWATGAPSVRAATTRILGQGVEPALAHFRAFSFVSGIIFARQAVELHDTARWDGSIYIQIYLACRILADGGRLGSIARPSIRKDIRIDDRTVDTYATKLAAQTPSVQPRHTGIDMVIRVTADAITPLLAPSERSGAIRRVAMDVLLYSYFFWLLEYRRIGGISAGIGVARTSTPALIVGDLTIANRDRVLLRLLYAAITVAGLCVPPRVGTQATRRAASALRRRRQRAAG